MLSLQKAIILSLGSLLAFGQTNPSNPAGQSSPANSQQPQNTGQNSGQNGQTAGQNGQNSGQNGQTAGQNTQSNSDKMGAGQKNGTSSGTNTDMSASSSAMKSSGSLNAADRKFIEHAAEGGKMEVAMGRLAAEKASSADVKAFGQMMVDDHSKANMELETLAQQKGVMMPAEKTDSNQSKLANMSGEQFDRAYISMMQADHKKDVADFEKASRSASDPDVKAFAAKTLPTLQMHRDRVNSLKGGSGSRMSGSSGSGTGSAATSGNNTDSANNANRDTGKTGGSTPLKQ